MPQWRRRRTLLFSDHRIKLKISLYILAKMLSVGLYFCNKDFKYLNRGFFEIKMFLSLFRQKIAKKLD